MSVQAISWVLDHSKSQGATRCVLMSIANHVGVDGEGWVYVQQVMREANCSHDTYKRAVQWAEQHRELAREANQGEAKKAAPNRRPNHFRLLKLGGAGCPPQAESAPRNLLPPSGASCPPQDAPPEPSPSLEPSKEPSLSLDPRIQEAFALLVERDFNTVEIKRHPRAVRRACRQEREQDGSLVLLSELAAKHPDWSAEALANAINLGDVMNPPLELPDCAACDNTRWIFGENGMVRCTTCWPVITENQRAS